MLAECPQRLSVSREEAPGTPGWEAGRGHRGQEENVSPEDLGVNQEWPQSRPAGWRSEGTTGFVHMEAISDCDKDSAVINESMNK